jgi:hypothetical protein
MFGIIFISSNAGVVIPFVVYIDPIDGITEYNTILEKTDEWHNIPH